MSNIIKCQLYFSISIPGKLQAKIPKRMKTFEDSLKSKKTVSSMIERKGDNKGKKSGE